MKYKSNTHVVLMYAIPILVAAAFISTLNFGSVQKQKRVASSSKISQPNKQYVTQTVSLPDIVHSSVEIIK